MDSEMLRIVILANGDFPAGKDLREKIVHADILICCDGAFSTLRRHPELAEAVSGHEYYITGDLDSLPANLRKKFGPRIIPYEDQDINDLTKSFILACRLAAGRRTEITFLGATGKREDHCIANMGLLMEYAGSEFVRSGKCSIVMESDHSTIFAATDSITFSCRDGQPVSVFSPDPSLTVTSEGLKWQTSGVRFTNWWQASLNRAIQERVTLTLSHPSRILVVLGR